MFARFIALLPFAILASASSHLKARNPCSGGTITCCNSLQTLDQADGILSSLGLVDAAASVGALVGLTCTPISVIGFSGNGCTEQVACCANDGFNGLVNLGCSPVNVNA